MEMPMNIVLMETPHYQLFTCNKAALLTVTYLSFLSVRRHCQVKFLGLCSYFQTTNHSLCRVQSLPIVIGKLSNVLFAIYQRIPFAGVLSFFSLETGDSLTIVEDPLFAIQGPGIDLVEKQ
jgi:hypothetical protein